MSAFPKIVFFLLAGGVAYAVGRTRGDRLRHTIDATLSDAGRRLRREPVLDITVPDDPRHDMRLVVDDDDSGPDAVPAPTEVPQPPPEPDLTGTEVPEPPPEPEIPPAPDVPDDRVAQTEPGGNAGGDLPGETEASVDDLASGPRPRRPGVQRDDSTPPAWVQPTSGECPATHAIKARFATGRYHEPGSKSYDKVIADCCYATRDEAEADGFSRAR